MRRDELRTENEESEWDWSEYTANFVERSVGWSVVMRAAARCGVGCVVAITADVTDYFTDLALATDRIEMGGFALGHVAYREGVVALVFHDYVQVRNASPQPETSFVPDEESMREVNELCYERLYTASALAHTHAGDSFVGSMDALLTKITGEEQRRLHEDFIPEIRGARYSPPGFLITGGNAPVIVAYAHTSPFAFVAEADGTWLLQCSRTVKAADPDYPARVAAREAARFPGRTFDELYEAIANTQYAIFRVERLRRLLRLR